MARSLILFVSLTLVLTSCSKTESPGSAANQPAPTTKQPAAESTKAKVEPGALGIGEARGSYTAKGETVELKYAYAGRGQRFGNESLIVILTDQPIPSNAVAEEIKSQPLLNGEKIRGLEYVIDKDGYWVRYHPSQYQESKNNQLADFLVEGDTVRGSDDDKGEFTNGKYSRSVKFVATIVK